MAATYADGVATLRALEHRLRAQHGAAVAVRRLLLDTKAQLARSVAALGERLKDLAGITAEEWAAAATRGDAETVAVLDQAVEAHAQIEEKLEAQLAGHPVVAALARAEAQLAELERQHQRLVEVAAQLDPPIALPPLAPTSSAA